MGIKHFFQWFKGQFSEHIKNMHKGQDLASLGVNIDNLMIDMNGIFHSSAQKIYEYGNYKPNPRLLRNGNKKRMGSVKKQIAMFEDVCLAVENIFKIVNPKKRLILCVDGPAPLSKQNQQRQRRFRSSAESSDDSPFNSNCITPGTKFMDYLTKYIDWYIRKRINEDDSWRNIEIVFSNEKSPGEGEHKIINYIRYYGDPNDTYCINGMDADLIMLAFGTHVSKFYILREDMYNFHNDFFCVDIGSIRGGLSSILKWPTGGAFEFDEKTAIDDFIFLCFMVGNDFLPHIPSIEIIERGIELILEVYKDVGFVYGHITRLFNNRVEFLPIPLSIFLEEIGRHEKDNLEGKLSKKREFFPDPLLEGCAKENSRTNKWDVDIEKYKKEYFDFSFPPSTDEKSLCHDYLEGMQWVLSYYTRGVPNWKWNFRHHYAPFASVLAKHVKSFCFPTYTKTIPSTPFQQLLCVLPPKSADLIPEPLCRLLTDETSPLKKQCPENFDVDLRGKRKEWEGVVILPMVNFNLVRDCYLKVINKVSSVDLKRNITGSSYKYEYVEGLAGFFRSYYGDIERCSVRIIPIDL